MYAVGIKVIQDQYVFVAAAGCDRESAGEIGKGFSGEVMRCYDGGAGMAGSSDVSVCWDIVGLVVGGVGVCWFCLFV